VNQMARIRPLLGNTAATLRRVRDPVLVADTLKGDGVACLEVARDASGITCDGTWLCKPRHSAGGARISFWDDRARAGGYPGGDFYFQRYADGLACSAVYVAARRESVLLGITRQIIGATWCGAGGFRYCGSVGPLELPDDVVVDIARLGDVLATRFDLVGLFGADLIVNPQGVWLVEVNPRYTASTELLDWAHNVSTVAWHVSACDAGRLPTRAPQDHRRLVAKCVLFATGPTVIQRDLRQQYDQPLSHGWPAIADVPAPGTAIEAGGPIVTIMAEGDDQEDVLAQLRGKAADVRNAVTA
jgi:predicted ATP-grasp superfamily ATP-dependent carboligase